MNTYIAPDMDDSGWFDEIVAPTPRLHAVAVQHDSL